MQEVQAQVKQTMERPSAALTLHLMTGLSLIQSQHHVGTKGLTVAMSTAIKITTGVSTELPRAQVTAGHPVYSAIHDSLHSHDTRSEMLTLAAPWRNHRLKYRLWFRLHPLFRCSTDWCSSELHRCVISLSALRILEQLWFETTWSSVKHGQKMLSVKVLYQLSWLPSGKLTVCELENDHRNSGFTHE